jgi:phosphoribosyl 1,2-cyclic phosphate phosphodiesterase
LSSTLTFLGTGTSVGIPVIGCRCPVCTSDDPQDTRTRSSVVLETPEAKILVDFGTDLRQQALREGLTKIDAVLITHQHLDHIMGFDDLRAFCWHRPDPLPLYGGPGTLATLRRMFPWAFESHDHPGYVRLAAHEIEEAFPLAGTTVTALPVEHGQHETFGYRFDLSTGHSLAYLPDVKRIPETTLARMNNLEVLVIDALRPSDHPTHMSHREALAAAGDIDAKQTFLTHLTHDISAADLTPSLPPNITVAHDGMKLVFDAGQPCAAIPAP